MGLFDRPKRKWESVPADQMADALMGMKPDEAKKAMEQIKKGKVPGLTVKQQKQIEKDYKRQTEGERGLGALFAGLKGGGSKGHLPDKEKYHPSEYKNRLASGKSRVGSAQEAMNIKKSDPALYQRILEQEARRRGL